MTSPFVPISRLVPPLPKSAKTELYLQTQALYKLKWIPMLEVIPEIVWHHAISSYMRKEIELLYAIVMGAQLLMDDSIGRAFKGRREGPTQDAKDLRLTAKTRTVTFVGEAHVLNIEAKSEFNITGKFKDFILPANQDAAKAFCWTQPQEGIHIGTEDEFNWARLTQTWADVKPRLEKLDDYEDRRHLKAAQGIIKRVDAYVEGRGVEQRSAIETLAMQFLVNIGRCLVHRPEGKDRPVAIRQ